RRCRGRGWRRPAATTASGSGAMRACAHCRSAVRRDLPCTACERSRLTPLLQDAEPVQHEAVHLGLLAVAAEAAGLAAVAGFHVGAEDHRLAGGVEVAQP